MAARPCRIPSASTGLQLLPATPSPHPDGITLCLSHGRSRSPVFINEAADGEKAVPQPHQATTGPRSSGAEAVTERASRVSRHRALFCIDRYFFFFLCYDAIFGFLLIYLYSTSGIGVFF